MILSSNKSALNLFTSVDCKVRFGDLFTAKELCNWLPRIYPDYVKLPALDLLVRVCCLVFILNPNDDFNSILQSKSLTKLSLLNKISKAGQLQSVKVLPPGLFLVLPSGEMLTADEISIIHGPGRR